VLKSFYRRFRPDHDAPQNVLDGLRWSDQKSGDQKTACDPLSPNL
jgi:hypothetical protein